MTHHASKVLENAHYITYGSAGTGVLVFGLNLGDISAIVSIIGVVFGVVLQIYNAKRQRSR